MGSKNSTPESPPTNELTEVLNENQPSNEVILLGYENSRTHSTLEPEIGGHGRGHGHDFFKKSRIRT